MASNRALEYDVGELSSLRDSNNGFAGDSFSTMMKPSTAAPFRTNDPTTMRWSEGTGSYGTRMSGSPGITIPSIPSLGSTASQEKEEGFSIQKNPSLPRQALSTAPFCVGVSCGEGRLPPYGRDALPEGSPLGLSGAAMAMPRANLVPTQAIEHPTTGTASFFFRPLSPSSAAKQPDPVGSTWPSPDARPHDKDTAKWKEGRPVQHPRGAAAPPPPSPPSPEKEKEEGTVMDHRSSMTFPSSSFPYPRSPPPVVPPCAAVSPFPKAEESGEQPKPEEEMEGSLGTSMRVPTSFSPLWSDGASVGGRGGGVKEGSILHPTPSVSWRSPLAHRPPSSGTPSLSSAMGRTHEQETTAIGGGERDGAAIVGPPVSHAARPSSEPTTASATPAAMKGRHATEATPSDLASAISPFRCAGENAEETAVDSGVPQTMTATDVPLPFPPSMVPVGRLLLRQRQRIHDLLHASHQQRVEYNALKEIFQRLVPAYRALVARVGEGGADDTPAPVTAPADTNVLLASAMAATTTTTTPPPSPPPSPATVEKEEEGSGVPQNKVGRARPCACSSAAPTMERPVSLSPSSPSPLSMPEPMLPPAAHAPPHPQEGTTGTTPWQQDRSQEPSSLTRRSIRFPSSSPMQTSAPVPPMADASPPSSECLAPPPGDALCRSARRTREEMLYHTLVEELQDVWREHLVVLEDRTQLRRQVERIQHEKQQQYHTFHQHTLPEALHQVETQCLTQMRTDHERLTQRDAAWIALQNEWEARQREWERRSEKAAATLAQTTFRLHTVEDALQQKDQWLQSLRQETALLHHRLTQREEGWSHQEGEVRRENIAQVQRLQEALRAAEKNTEDVGHAAMERVQQQQWLERQQRADLQMALEESQRRGGQAEEGRRHAVRQVQEREERVERMEKELHALTVQCRRWRREKEEMEVQCHQEEEKRIGLTDELDALRREREGLLRQVKRLRSRATRQENAVEAYRQALWKAQSAWQEREGRCSAGYPAVLPFATSTSAFKREEEDEEEEEEEERRASGSHGRGSRLRRSSTDVRVVSAAYTESGMNTTPPRRRATSRKREDQGKEDDIDRRHASEDTCSVADRHRSRKEGKEKWLHDTEERKAKAPAERIPEVERQTENLHAVRMENVKKTRQQDDSASHDEGITKAKKTTTTTTVHLMEMPQVEAQTAADGRKQRSSQHVTCPHTTAPPNTHFTASLHHTYAGLVRSPSPSSSPSSSSYVSHTSPSPVHPASRTAAAPVIVANASTSHHAAHKTVSPVSHSLPSALFSAFPTLAFPLGGGASYHGARHPYAIESPTSSMGSSFPNGKRDVEDRPHRPATVTTQEAEGTSGTFPVPPLASPSFLTRFTPEVTPTEKEEANTEKAVCPTAAPPPRSSATGVPKEVCLSLRVSSPHVYAVPQEPNEERAIQKEEASHERGGGGGGGGAMEGMHESPILTASPFSTAFPIPHDPVVKGSFQSEREEKEEEKESFFSSPPEARNVLGRCNPWTMNPPTAESVAQGPSFFPFASPSTLPTSPLAPRQMVRGAAVHVPQEEEGGANSDVESARERLTATSDGERWVRREEKAGNSQWVETVTTPWEEALPSSWQATRVASSSSSSAVGSFIASARDVSLPAWKPSPDRLERTREEKERTDAVGLDSLLHAPPAYGEEALVHGTSSTLLSTTSSASLIAEAVAAHTALTMANHAAVTALTTSKRHSDQDSESLLKSLDALMDHFQHSSPSSIRSSSFASSLELPARGTPSVVYPTGKEHTTASTCAIFSDEKRNEREQEEDDALRKATRRQECGTCWPPNMDGMAVPRETPDTREKQASSSAPKDHRVEYRATNACDDAEDRFEGEEGKQWMKPSSHAGDLSALEEAFSSPFQI